MNIEKAIEGGVTGATTLTILHEIVRKFAPDAPRMDEIGKEALGKIFEKLKLDVPDDDKMYVLAIVAELISNGMYYSLVGAGKKDDALLRGAFLGLAAGVGAVTLPSPLGLNEQASARTTKTKVMTIAWYLIGGIIASAVAKRLQERKNG